MLASEVESIDVLLDDDPGALDEDLLKARASALTTLMSRVQAQLLAVVRELDCRKTCVSDGMTDTRSWLAHHTAVSRVTAGSLVWLTQRLRSMPLFAAALAEGDVTFDH